ncbi:MAG: methylmalonyl Co-A mutase-associated GTPase MeaB [Opitutaceae bacterium]
MRPPPDIPRIQQGLLAGERAPLAQAITLIESSAAKHKPAARELMQAALPHSGKAIRVGLTGVPGAGKSTFIEALGLMLCEQGKKVAVLAIDPSSSRTGGSILGDKTRMEELSRHPNAFIRPSPAGRSLGGVALRTREALLLCEAANYDVILVETVGVGQSETAVRTMTDFFLLLQISGAGDELQGIKKGVIELADMIAVNKADGKNLLASQQARLEYERVFHFLAPFTPGWKPKALTCSALTNEGIDVIWETVESFIEATQASGVFQSRRSAQNVDWFQSLLQQAVMEQFTQAHAESIATIESKVQAGKLSVSLGLDTLLSNSL